MDETRSILHLDLDAFFCAVEEQRDPQLRGVAFAVGGRPEGRGVVSSCSYAARAFGVHSAMPMAQALRLCPDLAIVPPYFPAYRKASQQVMATLREISPLLEQISIDEAFLDISSHPGPILELAQHIQESIRHEMGLPNSLGIASNKLVAKIATEVGKHQAPKGSPPNAITLVPAGEEAAFLATLPVRMLWGVGPKTAARLAKINITLIGQLADYPLVEMVRQFGKNGYELSLRARGIDPRPIVTEHEAKSISQEVTYPQDIANPQELQRTLEEQSQHIARQLQRLGLSARTIKIKLRWPNFETITRQTTLEEPTREAQVIAASAVQLFQALWSPGHPVRLLGVGVSSLDSPPRQIGLWDVDWESERKIQDLLAEIQDKYGEEALSRGYHPLEKNNPG